MTPQDHNKVLGILNLTYGGLHLVGSIWTVIFFFLISPLPNRPYPDNGFDLFFSPFMLVLMVIGLLFSVSSVIAGYALLKRKSWARMVAIVAGIFATLAIPYGTGLGVYTLWFMFNREGKDFYANNFGAWSDDKVRALPGAPANHNWAADSQNKGREREYVPPPQMPNWR